VFTGDERRTLDALCRQIDVRKTVSTSYRLDWSSLDTERPVEPSVLSGLVAVLLANAARVGDARGDAINDGWGLKCANSALGALDLRERLPREPELRAWGIETLDRLRTPRPGDA